MIRPFPKPHPFQRPKLERLPERKRVTLIASFPATAGFAICADSQETVTEWDPDAQDTYEVRVTVQKIARIEEGKYQIAVCGGGHAGLIEGFIVRAQRALKEEDAVVCTMERPASVEAIHARLERELQEFYASDVRLCPDSVKQFKLFIAACCPIAQQFAVWVSENIVLRDARIDAPELNGWSHRLYEDTAERLFKTGMTINQAALASVYTVMIAKNTSNYVRDPLSLVAVDKDGIHTIDAAYTVAMESRLQEYEKRMNNLFLACSDTAVSMPDLEDRIKEFGDAALALHKEQINKQAEGMTVAELLSARGLRSLPSPILLTTRGLEVEHDRQKISETQERFRQMRDQIKNTPRMVTCSKCQFVFDVEGANDPARAITSAPCPACGEQNEVRRKSRQSASGT